MEVANDLFSLEVRLCYIVGTSVELAVLDGPLKKIEASCLFAHNISTNA